MLPDLVGSEHHNRTEEPRQRAGDAVDGCLSGTPLTTLRRKRVKPVLENVKIKGAQVHHAEVIERVIDSMEIEALIEFQALGHELTGPSKHPTIQFLEGIFRYSVARGIEVK